MICPDCRGRGWFVEGGDEDGLFAERCQTCDGKGVVSREQRFVCASCRAVSYNLNDIAQRYCGRCHQFADDDAP